MSLINKLSIFLNDPLCIHPLIRPFMKISESSKYRRILTGSSDILVG